LQDLEWVVASVMPPSCVSVQDQGTNRSGIRKRVRSESERIRRRGQMRRGGKREEEGGEEGEEADWLVMRDEIATTMRLLGVTRLDQLGPHLVRQHSYLTSPPCSNLFYLLLKEPIKEED
jgi:hypothetical protein